MARAECNLATGGVSLVWGLNLATSNLALQHASLGLVMITRNCSPIITFIIEAVFQEAMPMTPPVSVSGVPGSGASMTASAARRNGWPRRKRLGWRRAA